MCGFLPLVLVFERIFVDTKKLTLIITFVFITLAAIFAFYDLPISKAFVNKKSVWGNFLAKNGEYPGLILVAFAFFIAAASTDKENKRRYFYIFIHILVGAIITWFTFSIFLYRNFGGETANKWNLYSLLFGCIVSLICSLFLRIKAFNFSMKNKVFSHITLWLFLTVTVFFVHICKEFWGRVRFRDLQPDFSDFTPWYLPQGVTGHRSFPSGHSSVAWLLLPACLWFVKMKKGGKILGILLVVSWGFAVSLSRVAIGAHYASDILFSTALSNIVFLQLYRCYKKKEI